jgi:hypothetical protein
MKTTTFAMAAALMAVATMPVAGWAQDAQAQKGRGYSVETTTIGTLLDDPEAAAILEKLIPTVYANDMFQSMGRPNTLRVAQQYESVLTDAKMAEIQAELDKLPPKE